MSQLFSPRADLFVRLFLSGGFVGVVVAGLLMNSFNQPAHITGVNRAPQQPVPFSHAHHVDGLGIDCRYCHTGVEEGDFAGIPPTETCMTCHSQVWNDAEMLEPVRASFAEGEPLRWQRVYNLPDFVYFNHAIHIAKGISCESCHGSIDRMPLTMQAVELTMGFCLDCHRKPEEFARPREAVFAMGWKSIDPLNDFQLSEIDLNRIHSERLVDCSICHR